MIINKFFELGSNSLNNAEKIVIVIDVHGIETYNNNRLNTVSSVMLSDYVHIQGNFNVYIKENLMHKNIKYMTIKNDIITLIKECNNLLEVEKIYNIHTTKLTLVEVL